MCISDSLSIDNSLFLSSEAIFDKKGNKLDRALTSFIASDNADTNIIKVGKVQTPFSDNKIDYINPSFIIEFTDAFDQTNIDKSILLYR